MLAPLIWTVPVSSRASRGGVKVSQKLRRSSLTGVDAEVLKRRRRTEGRAGAAIVVLHEMVFAAQLVWKRDTVRGCNGGSKIVPGNWL